jgi:hypothetical protein
MQYRILRAAKAFGKMPHEFRNAPLRAQAEAIAFVETENAVSIYQSETSNDK